MGELPSQQPPDWWNISSPCCDSSFAISSRAEGVASTCWGSDDKECLLKEAHGAGAIADQLILGLLVVIEHHAMVFAADAGLLVTAECGMRGIEVVAVRPHAAGVNFATEGVGAVHVTGPDAGSETIKSVVG